MSTNDKYEDFNLNISNKLLDYEKTYAKFVSAIDLNNMKNEIKKQYKDKVVIVENNNKIKITKNNSVIRMKLEDEKNFLFHHKYIYEIEAEFINLEKKGTKICLYSLSKRILKHWRGIR